MKDNTNSSDSRLDVDRRISEMLDQRLSKAPVTPWFTRKVMNRLPPKRRPLFSVMEICAYIIAAVTVIAVITRRVSHVIAQPETTTYGDLLFIIGMTMFATLLWALIIIPIVKRE